ncbi:hypothetical protein [Nonomuraea sp. NPDC046570]|uniref:hypothetical protein n=1 Tax=Nonomuraea sp. NPDC046570 TaxID=3155255 RepID=UPI003409121F
MKHMIAGIAGVAALLVAAVPAQAAAADPVRALKKQYAQGKGVRFAERTGLVAKGKSEPLQKRTGVFRFDGDRIVRSDISAKGLGKKPLFKPERTIRIGSVVYVKDAFHADDLPKGKPWYRKKDGKQDDAGGMLGQPVNVAELPTLKALMAKAKRDKDGYRGSITFEELAAVSPTFQDNMVFRADDSTAITWRLSLGKDGLPRKLTTSFPGEGFVPMWEGLTVTGETTFTGWGSRVSVKAPPSNQVSSALISDEGKVSLGD